MSDFKILIDSPRLHTYETKKGTTFFVSFNAYIESGKLGAIYSGLRIMGGQILMPATRSVGGKWMTPAKISKPAMQALADKIQTVSLMQPFLEKVPLVTIEGKFKGFYTQDDFEKLFPSYVIES